MFMLTDFKWRWPSSESKGGGAAKFIDWCLETNLPQTAKAPWMMFRPDSEIFRVSRNWSIEVVACSLECGLGWIMRQFDYSIASQSLDMC